MFFWGSQRLYKPRSFYRMRGQGLGWKYLYCARIVFENEHKFVQAWTWGGTQGPHFWKNIAETYDAKIVLHITKPVTIQQLRRELELAKIEFALAS